MNRHQNLLNKLLQAFLEISPETGKPKLSGKGQVYTRQFCSTDILKLVDDDALFDPDSLGYAILNCQDFTKNRTTSRESSVIVLVVENSPTSHPPSASVVPSTLTAAKRRTRLMNLYDLILALRSGMHTGSQQDAHPRARNPGRNCSVRLPVLPTVTRRRRLPPGTGPHSIAAASAGELRSTV